MRETDRPDISGIHLQESRRRIGSPEIRPAAGFEPELPAAAGRRSGEKALENEHRTDCDGSRPAGGLHVAPGEPVREHDAPQGVGPFGVKVVNREIQARLRVAVQEFGLQFGQEKPDPGNQRDDLFRRETVQQVVCVDHEKLSRPNGPRPSQADLLHPAFEDFFKEPVFHYRDLVAHDGPDVWLFGHWHKDQGIKEIDGKLFVNQGAVSRGSLIRENTERTPQVTVVELTDEGVKARTVDLNVPPATAVFDFERKQKLESERRDIETFIAKLQSDLAFDPSATIEDNVQSLDFAAEVREAALGYLDQARSEAGCT